MLNPEWVKKEYERIRKSRKIFGAKAAKKYLERYPEKYVAQKRTQHMRPGIRGNHLHHWSYMEMHTRDVIELSPADHYEAHRHIIYDKKEMMYRTRSGTLLDSKKAHIEYINTAIEMKAQSKTKLKQLKTGVHLVCITDAVIIKDKNQMPFVTEDGETGITIRFSTGNNLHFDVDYWLNGDRQSYFNKMCASAGINTENPKFRAESRGKRLWICIKEVHDIDGDKPVIDELTGPAINYYLFDTIVCIDPNRKPVVKGNPDDNEGIASGVFLDYKQIMPDGRNYQYKDVQVSIEKNEVKVSFPEKEEPKSNEINWDEG